MKRLVRPAVALVLSIAGIVAVLVGLTGTASSVANDCINFHNKYHCVYEHANYVRNARSYGWGESDSDYTNTGWNIPYSGFGNINDKASSLENRYAGCYMYYFDHVGYGSQLMFLGPGYRAATLGPYNDRISSHYAAC